MNFGILNLILLLILLALVGQSLWSHFRVKWAAKKIDEEEFREGIRSAQVIDVRDRAEFKASHIMGARNIPGTEFKQSVGGLRKDQPIYLYDTKRSAMAGRCAIILKKQGFNDIYILKNGFDSWTGKIKAQKNN
jgi:rhodanese-related sulfurtransferase